MTTGLTREGFLALSWEEQKKTDFRKVFDPTTDTSLVANCINHQDDTASMHIYENAVWCYGCRKRWWPDQFLKDLGHRQLVTERGARKQPAPKFIPLAVVDTYRRWLWGHGDDAGHYQDRSVWLQQRGLHMRTCFDNFIGHTGEAFTIPVLNAANQVLSIRYRKDDLLASEERPKYWGTAGANQAMLYVPRHTLSQTMNFKYGLILCEGELDALRLAQEGYPAASLTNGCGALKEEHIPELRRQLPITERVTVCYDMDDPGRDAAARVVGLLESNGIRAHALSWVPSFGKDVTEMVRRYGANELRTLLESLWRCG